MLLQHLMKKLHKDVKYTYVIDTDTCNKLPKQHDQENKEYSKKILEKSQFCDSSKFFK